MTWCLSKLGLRTAALLVTVACGGSDKVAAPKPQLFRDAAAVATTGNASVPVIATHKDGSRLAVLAAGGSPRGAILITPDNKSVTVFTDDQGRPQRMVAAGVTYLFSNWTSSTVDLAAVTSTGEIHIRRGVSLRGSGTSSRSHAALTSASASSAPSTAELLSAASTAITIGSCAAGVLLTVPTLSLSTALTAAACGAALVTIFNEATGVDEDDMLATREGVGLMADVIGCAGRNALDCISLVTGEAARIAEEAERTMESSRSPIDLADGALRSGSGDVQITLTWDSRADIDLHVTDPAGATIYYSNRSSPSGGRLDVDDIDGFGPENVFWPQGRAPTGSYRVRVHYYSGEGATPFRVLVQAFGQVRSYTGVLASQGQSRDVVTFASGQPLPNLIAAVAIDARGSPLRAMTNAKNARPIGGKRSTRAHPIRRD